MQEGPSIWRAWPEGVQWSPQAWVAYVRELGQLLVNARELRQLRPCCAAVALHERRDGNVWCGAPQQ